MKLFWLSNISISFALLVFCFFMGKIQSKPFQLSFVKVDVVVSLNSSGLPDFRAFVLIFYKRV